MSQDWREISPLGEEEQRESPEERLRRAKEDLMVQLGGEGEKRGNFSPWLVGFLSITVLVLLAWNISLRRSLSSGQGRKEGGQVRQIFKERVEKEGMKGRPRGESEGKKVSSYPPIIQKPSEPERGKGREESPIVPFPLPLLSSHQPSSGQPFPSQRKTPSVPSLSESSRSPFPLQASNLPATPLPSPENFQVIGLVITEKGKLAVIKVGTKTVTVTEGETIPFTGWEVKEIEPERVVLVFKDRPKEKLVLRPSF